MWKHSGNFGNVFKLLTHIGGRLTILILNGSVALGIVISPSSDVNDNLIGKCKILFIKQPHGVSLNTQFHSLQTEMIHMSTGIIHVIFSKKRAHKHWLQVATRCNIDS